MFRGVITLLGVFIPLFFVVSALAAIPTVNSSGYAYTPAFTRSDGKCGYWRIKYYVGPTWISSGSDGLTLDGETISLINNSGEDSDYGYSYQIASYKQTADGVHWELSVASSYYKFRPPYTGLDTYFTLLEEPDPDSCSVPCASQIDSYDALCGSRENWEWTDESQCIASCTCDPNELNDAIFSCPEGDTFTVDYDSCTVTCGSCNQEKLALIQDCGEAGVTGVLPTGCGGRCRTCSDYWQDAQKDCSHYGGVHTGYCSNDDDNSKIAESFDWKCKEDTLGGDFETDTEDGQEPPDTVADETPAIDPTNDSDPVDNQLLAWQQATKENLDKLVSQGNRDYDVQENIAENNRRTVDNLKGIGETLDAINTNITTVGSQISDLKGDGEIDVDTGDIEDKLDGINDTLTEIKDTDVTMDPLTDDFDYEGNAEYTESDLDGLLKTDEELLASIGLGDEDVMPTWQEALSGSGIQLNNVDSCIDGEVMGADFNFCFNKFSYVWSILGNILVALSYFKAFNIVVGR